jgi:hypothetical protein
MLNLINDFDRDHVGEVTAFNFAQSLENAIAVYAALTKLDSECRVDLVVLVRHSQRCNADTTYVHGIQNIGGLINDTSLVYDRLGHPCDACFIDVLNGSGTRCFLAEHSMVKTHLLGERVEACLVSIQNQLMSTTDPCVPDPSLIDSL